VIRDKEKLRVVPGDKPANKEAKRGDPAAAVDVDLSRVRVHVTPAAEWRQMFEESVRLLRDHFWVADMAGNDWAALLARYRPLLGRIASRDDLSDLLWEVQAELGTSHAYETPPERPKKEARKLGHLGADLQRGEDGLWRITRVLPGESTARAGGSDGDIVTAMIQERGLGPVVGMRSWGGVVGIYPGTKLVDGSAVTQPRYAMWIVNRGWSVENHGVDPDVEVPVPPQAWAQGLDPQLDTAVELALAALAPMPGSPRRPLRTVRPPQHRPCRPARVINVDEQTHLSVADPAQRAVRTGQSKGVSSRTCRHRSCGPARSGRTPGDRWLESGHPRCGEFRCGCPRRSLQRMRDHPMRRHCRWRPGCLVRRIATRPIASRHPPNRVAPTRLAQ
jgi:hypothetical protein